MSDRVRAIGLILSAFLLPFSLAAADSPGFSLSFHPVGTPEFMGPPKISEAGFAPPVAETIYSPQEAQCLAQKGAGEYEVLIRADGTVDKIRSHHVPIEGDACEREFLFPYVMKWHFKPGTYNGKATAVYMWFGIEGSVANSAQQSAPADAASQRPRR